MEIKSHLFEIMQFCFLHSVLLFLYLSVLLKPNFLKKWKNTCCCCFFYALFHIVTVTLWLTLQYYKACNWGVFYCTRLQTLLRPSASFTFLAAEWNNKSNFQVPAIGRTKCEECQLLEFFFFALSFSQLPFSIISCLTFQWLVLTCQTLFTASCGRCWPEMDCRF